MKFSLFFEPQHRLIKLNNQSVFTLFSSEMPQKKGKYPQTINLNCEKQQVYLPVKETKTERKENSMFQIMGNSKTKTIRARVTL
jgi:hypothetical protein